MRQVSVCRPILQKPKAHVRQSDSHRNRKDVEHSRLERCALMPVLLSTQEHQVTAPMRRVVAPTLQVFEPLATSGVDGHVVTMKRLFTVSR